MESLDSNDTAFLELANLNNSLDELISDYFENKNSPIPEPEIGREKPNQRPVSTISTTSIGNRSDSGSSNSGRLQVANFSLGASGILMDDTFGSCLGNLSQMTTLSCNLSTSSSSEASSLNSDASSKNKIVQLKASRQSMTYHIVFDPPKNERGEKQEHGNIASIKIHTRGMKTNEEASSKEEIELKKIIQNLETRNKQLENEVRSLMEKLGKAHKTIGKLEVEVANFFCSSN